ncbi:MAG: methyltransferase domain-containing protein [Bryobacteraceae bacterium]|jgi:tRNA (mo5U34)-methyltransferase
MSEARDARVIEESRRQIERLSKLGWYHSIELPGGSVIEGHQTIQQLRTRIRQFPIPEKLTGKRVLDIGAWDGWFSFEMERRGADVLALDSTRNTRLLEAKNLLGSRIEYHIGDICRLTAKDLGTFDIVLFLGVLYHVKHPIAALENVCGMCRDMACIESFVTDPDPAAIPVMEFYETTELRGQLDNWVGPNAACLLAFCRTAGFARVDFESALGERAHITGYRKWRASEGNEPAPAVLCIDNSATHDQNFSSAADDYVTFYFTCTCDDLTCDTVFPQIGDYGSRPIHVARSGGGWQATCKLPPGLGSGWHNAMLRTSRSEFSAPLRIGIDDPRWDACVDPGLRLTRLADGKTFESKRIRVGDDSAISVWVAGLPAQTTLADVCVRLNGTDLPAIWLAPADGDAPRQINALLPAGIEPSVARVSLAFGAAESESVEIELHN